MEYVVNKYSGRVYCGNAFFDTFEECIQFADDGFCNKAVIQRRDGKRYTIKIDAIELSDN